MQNTEIIERFEHYLKDEKNVSANTLSSYMRDIRQLAAYLDTHSDLDIVSADAATLGEYVLWQRESGKSVATVSRSIASMKSLYSYLFIQQIITANPATKLVTDRNTERLPQILTNREVELLLEQPRCVDAKGYRDRAMLELLYATGMRVTELIDLDIGDVNLGAGVVRCHSRNKERVIPMYPAAIKALEDYITLVRPQMIAVPDEPSLFVNVSGDECPVRASGRSSSITRKRRTSRRTSRLTRCAILLPRICWKTAPISTRSRKCSVMPTSPRRRCTRIW